MGIHVWGMELGGFDVEIGIGESFEFSDSTNSDTASPTIPGSDGGNGDNIEVPATPPGNAGGNASNSEKPATPPGNIGGNGDNIEVPATSPGNTGGNGSNTEAPMTAPGNAGGNASNSEKPATPPGNTGGNGSNTEAPVTAPENSGEIAGNVQRPITSSDNSDGNVNNKKNPESIEKSKTPSVSSVGDIRDNGISSVILDSNPGRLDWNVIHENETDKKSEAAIADNSKKSPTVTPSAITLPQILQEDSEIEIETLDVFYIAQWLDDLENANINFAAEDDVHVLSLRINGKEQNWKWCSEGICLEENEALKKSCYLEMIVLGECELHIDKKK